MNKIKLISSVVLVLIFAVTSAGCITGDTYYVGIDTDGTDPFIIQDAKTGEFSGFDVESMKWIAQHENMNIEFISMNWDNIIPSLLSGEIDLIYSDMSVTEERMELINFSKPYMTLDIVVASNKNLNTTMDDFFTGNATIGIPSGTTSQNFVRNNFGEDYDHMVSDGIIVVYSYVDEMFSALDNGDVQTVVFEKSAIRGYAENSKNIYILGETGVNEGIAVGMRKENTELLEKINHGLTDLMDSDKWIELKKKYGLN
ncbi:MAG: ABC transporter substrate-binding protein [Methanocorpusculum sp.]|nr:ABC transporter substrate-binding protein [Methanocorpusculum sp.]